MADKIETDLIVNAVAEGFDKVKGEMDGIVKSQERLTVEQTAAQAKARGLTNQLNQLGQEVADGTKTIEDATKEYAQFSDELNDLSRGAKDAGSSTKISITDMKSAIDMGVAAFRQVAEAARWAYDEIKQGAALELASRQFGILAENIGTTSDALLNDLRAATEGMQSDAQLMAGAGEIMSLGLADTAEEAVRLTSAVSALGADMNQVVLTLTNQTTARFDQIGIAVAGFDERLEELIATGMSADDAFNEAFLQQAEAQVDKLGSVADTSAGQIMQLEAEWANLTNAMKAGLAEAVTPTIAQINKEIDLNRLLVDAMDKGIITFDEYIAKKSEMSDMSYDFASATEEVSGQLSEYNGMLERTNDLSYRYIETTYAGDTATRAATLTTGEYIQTLGDSSSMIDLYGRNAEEAALKSAVYGQYIRDNLATVTESTAAQDAFNSSLENTASGFGSINTNVSGTIASLIEQTQFLAAGGDTIIAAIDAITAAVQSGDMDFDEAEESLQEAGVAALDLEQELTDMPVEDVAERLMALGMGPEEADKRAQELVNTLYAATSEPWIIDIFLNTSGSAPGFVGGTGDGTGDGEDYTPGVPEYATTGDEEDYTPEVPEYATTWDGDDYTPEVPEYATTGDFTGMATGKTVININNDVALRMGQEGLRQKRAQRSSARTM